MPPQRHVRKSFLQKLTRVQFSKRTLSITRWDHGLRLPFVRLGHAKLSFLISFQVQFSFRVIISCCKFSVFWLFLIIIIFVLDLPNINKIDIFLKNTIRTDYAYHVTSYWKRETITIYTKHCILDICKIIKTAYKYTKKIMYSNLYIIKIIISVKNNLKWTVFRL